MSDQQPQPSAATPPPADQPLTPDMDVDVQELMRLERQDLATSGITLTDQRARERVELTIALMRRYMTSAPWSPPPRPDRGLLGPHCSHHDDCAMDVCQDGYAWNPCHTPGCPICGGPPVQRPPSTGPGRRSPRR
ncbi:hypothetical protein [Actinomadura rupiterrae]|uniref:hypothetical protein n=1 Tax=Actinomadura rupiterrae TaxID=559627 RepID=UPI0020A2CE9B|nr:hypothetical protein [Actinomadura rupiterrae]MCP2337878.1 hypothetical protein [Actinomadura rupiterrae]